MGVRATLTAFLGAQLCLNLGNEVAAELWERGHAAAYYPATDFPESERVVWVSMGEYVTEGCGDSRPKALA